MSLQTPNPRWGHSDATERAIVSAKAVVPHYRGDCNESRTIVSELFLVPIGIYIYIIIERVWVLNVTAVVVFKSTLRSGHGHLEFPPQR